jgi:hypothetical protein
MYPFGGPQSSKPTSSMGLDFQQSCGASNPQVRAPSQVPTFLSSQPPRSEGESLLRRIFARGTQP